MEGADDLIDMVCSVNGRDYFPHFFEDFRLEFSFSAVALAAASVFLSTFFHFSSQERERSRNVWSWGFSVFSWF